MEHLTIEKLINEAKKFSEEMSGKNHPQLLGVTDGKAVGTYVEHEFEKYLADHYIVEIGNSAKGIDIPDEHIMTDIKVTSVHQPQSSCPFRSARQKVFGLGYNLLVFVYEKTDTDAGSHLNFKYCTFIEDIRTADYTTSRRIREMIEDGANTEDIIGYLQDKNIPGDEITYNQLAEEILDHTPEQGYLTISNALQWRLQYSRVIELDNTVDGVVNYEW